MAINEIDPASTATARARLPREAAAIVEAVGHDDTVAQALFQQSRQDKRIAGAALRELNVRQQHGAVLSLTGEIENPRAEADPVVFERAVALVKMFADAEAEDLLRRYIDAHANTATAFLAAGKAFLDAGAPHLALPHVEKALALEPQSAQGIDNLFVALLQLGRVREAVALIPDIIKPRRYRIALRQDFAEAFRRLEPGHLDQALLDSFVASFANDIGVGPSLLPHLIAAERNDEVVAIASNGAIDPRAWDEGALLDTVRFLERHGRGEIGLRLLCRCGGQSETFDERLDAALGHYSADQLRSVVLPALKVEEGRFSTVTNAAPYVEIAHRFMREGDVEGALDTLLHLARAIDDVTASQFYARYRNRIASIVNFLADKADGETLLERLPRFVNAWLPPEIRQFYAGNGIESVMAALGTASTRANALPGSRPETLREGYFRHHMERRESRPLPAEPDDAQLSEAALHYFNVLAGIVPPEAVPVSDELRDRLTRPTLWLGGKHYADVITTYFAMRNQVSVPTSGREIVWWYLNWVVSDKFLPSAVFNRSLLEDLSVPRVQHSMPGIAVTPFAELFCMQDEKYGRRLHPTLAVDSTLLFLTLVATLLEKYPQYRAFVAAMIPERGSMEWRFLESCLTLLANDPAIAGSRRTVPLSGEKILGALSGALPERPPHVVVPKAPQDVLLVGHATKSTGLGRNFRMLSTALASSEKDGIVTHELDYDAPSTDVSRRIRKWRRNCRSEPIVVYAINAHDVPLVLLKDLFGELSDVYAAGFFLWEMSRPPDVQRLGLDVIDEVWAPTRYVSDIYAPFRPTHVVGKGLYDSAHSAPAPIGRRQPSSPFRFLTVFDFDSSIERKNPLAVVQAFQLAFRAGENVELILKGSNINPAHWSNGLRHWERMGDAIREDKRIKLVTARYSEADMDKLLRSSDCFVSLHRAEGFAYVVADAMVLGIPVIASDYSGNADFCDSETAFPVACRLIPVDSRAMPFMAPGAEWADPEIASAAAQMRAVVGDYPQALAIATQGRARLLSKYRMGVFRETLLARIRAIHGSQQNDISAAVQPARV